MRAVFSPETFAHERAPTYTLQRGYLKQHKVSIQNPCSLYDTCHLHVHLLALRCAGRQLRCWREQAVHSGGGSCTLLVTSSDQQWFLPAVHGVIHVTQLHHTLHSIMHKVMIDHVWPLAW